MNKPDLVRHVAEETGTTRAAAEAAVNAMLNGISRSLEKGDSVRLPGFGVFETRRRPARTGRNPRTGGIVQIAASTVPAFKAGKTLKDAVNAGV